MSKKGVIGLSMETLVVIIISIVILAGGITLLYKFIGGAEDIKAQLDQRTEAELELLLVDQGKQVALPLHVAEVERGNTHTFGIGILNIDPDYSSYKISIQVDSLIGEQKQLVDLTPQKKAEIDRWVLYNDQTFNLEEGEHTKEAILVKVAADAEKGTYIFNAKVLRPDNSQYGNTQKFFVTVH